MKPIIRRAAYGLAYAVLVLPLFAQITLTSVAISDVDSASCRVVANVSPDSYVQVYYGITMGGPYTYNTAVGALGSSDSVFQQ